MRKFWYQVGLQWKMDLRSRDILVTYYGVPLGFYLLMGGVFVPIMPDMRQTLTASMAVWGVTMGGLLGSPHPLVEVFGSEVKKAYRVGGIPFWTVAAGNFLSAMVHLGLMSLVILLTAPLIFGAAMPEHWGVFLPGLLGLMGASVSVGMAFGVYVRDVSKLNMATQLVFIPSLLLSGIMFPADMLPGAMAAVGKLLPATWGFRAMCAESAGWDLLPLAVITLVCIALTAAKLKGLAKE